MNEGERSDVQQLVGGLAHDFNNLLAVITAFTDLVQRRMPPPDPLRGDLAQILRAADRARDLVQQMLAAARPTPPRLRPVDLRALLDEMRPMLARVIGDDVELSVRCPPATIVEADAGRLERVLLNLVMNARDAMIGGGQLSITVFGVEADAPQVAIAVTDTGIGMDHGVRDRIFEPFFTTKERGTGLGLSTVLAIVRESGGSIEVDSERGKGTTVAVRLPRARDVAPAIDEART